MAVGFNQNPHAVPDAISLPGRTRFVGSLAQQGNARPAESATLSFDLQQSHVAFEDGSTTFTRDIVVPMAGLSFDVPVQLVRSDDGEEVKIVIVHAVAKSVDDPGFDDERFFQILVP